MEFRGPILIATAFGLIVSGAIMMEKEQVAEAAMVPTQVQTVSGARSSCEKNGLNTSFGRLGCDTEATETTTWTRRTTGGGALFVSARGGN